MYLRPYRISSLQSCLRSWRRRDMIGFGFTLYTAQRSKLTAKWVASYRGHVVSVNVNPRKLLDVVLQLSINSNR